MPNDYFRFQQFLVQQGRSAMKVCTDACLFGAWMSQYAAAANTILDIGTGTGLLSLMLAQHSDAVIDAVEIDGDAAAQASDNFGQSPWAARLRIFHTSIQEYCNDRQYDCIIANPPFYNNDLRSPDQKKNLAYHSDALTLKQLMMVAKKMISPEGYFGVLIPFQRCRELERVAAENGWHTKIKVTVRQTPQHHFFRAMYLFSLSPASATESGIIIKDNDQRYTPAFSKLMKDYYLVPNNALT